MKTSRPAARGSWMHRTGLMVAILGVMGTFGARWGVFGRVLAGPPPWVYAVMASVGGVAFFLAPLVYGNAAIAWGGEPPGTDGKPIVLYLRPFEVDLRNTAQLLIGASPGVLACLTLVTREAWPLALLPLVLNVTREQRLHDALLPLGKLVSFAHPRKRLQPVGAWHFHARGDDWQGEVLRYMDQARLVIVCPGTSKSIEWEVRQALERVAPDRLLIEFRGGRAKRQRRFDAFRRLAGDVRRCPELPERLGDARYLVFAADGRPRLFGETSHPVELLKSLMWGDIGRDRLEPVLRALGIELPPAPSDRMTRASQRFVRFAIYIFAATLVGGLGILLVVLCMRLLR